MALAKGHSKIRCGSLSDRTKTAVYVVEQLTNVCSIIKDFLHFYLLIKVKFNITKISSSETDNSTTIIECEGIGYKRRF